MSLYADIPANKIKCAVCQHESRRHHPGGCWEQGCNCRGFKSPLRTLEESTE